MTFGSLFAGIGGIDLGLERAGMECRWQIEIDQFCRRVLAKHWPNVKRYGDVRRVTGEELEWVDVISAGYPCQPFSQAGQRKGAEDERHLWPEVARLAGVLRPRYLVLENVSGHLSLGFGEVLRDLARFGYDTEWLCLRASDFGASHQRKRVFLVAYRSGKGRWEDARSTSRNDTAHGRAGRDICQQNGYHVAGGEGADLAYRAGGRRGILREPSEQSGFADRGDTALADAERAEWWPDLECDEQARGRQQASNRLRSAGELLADAARHEQPGSQRQSRRLRRRRVCAAGEPLERVGKYTCGSCGGTFDAYEDDAGMLPIIRCRWCGDRGAGSITYDREHGGTGEPAEPDRPGEEDVADAGDRLVSQPGRGAQGRNGAGPAGAVLPDASGTGREGHKPGEPDTAPRQKGRSVAELRGAPFLFAPGPADPRWQDILAGRPDLAPALESPLCGVVDGIPDCLDGSGLEHWSREIERALSNRTKRLSRLGNSVVPDCAEWIGRHIVAFDQRRICA